MSILITGAPKQHWGRPDAVGPGRLRKVAIIGSHADSILFAPYRDPSWDIWVHSSTAQLVPKGRADRLFDLHPPHCFKVARKNGFLDYYQYLKDSKTPIYMQQAYPEIPQSVRYPLELIQSLWPDVPLGSMTALMVALALCEGVTHLGCWGVHYSQKDERDDQRISTEHWLGIARGSGVQILIPKHSPLCHEPKEIYGYESHATPEIYAEKLKKHMDNLARGLAPTGPVQPCETAEQEATANAIRRATNPEWGRQIDMIPPTEQIPHWFREDEDRQRAEAGLPPLDGYERTPAGLSRPHPGSESAESESGLGPDSGATGGGETPRDGLVQPSSPVVSSRAPVARGHGDTGKPARRAVVARPRRAARQGHSRRRAKA